MTEEDLIKKAQKADKQAFGLLYDKYLPQIYRFVFLKTNHKAVSQDLTSQVFLKAWQHIRNYKRRGNPFSSWLYQIAHNLVIDYYRTNKYQFNLEEVKEVAVVYEENIEKKIDNQKDLALIKKAIKKLPDKQQTVLIMKFVEGLSVQEIAKALKKSQGAVKVIQHRALKNLREIIDNGESLRKIKKT